jgi:hypothetical protein
MSHVPGEQLAERVELGRIAARTRFDVRESASELDVLDEDADDVRVRGRDVTSKRREQHILLLAEMLMPLGTPEVLRRLGDAAGVGARGPSQPQRKFQRSVMLVGEWDEGVVALH